METIFCFVDKEKLFPLSPSSNTKSPKLKMLGPLCDQTYKKTFFCNAQRRLKEICVFKQQPQEQWQKWHEQDILQKHHRSLRPTGARHEFLCVFGDDFYVSATQDAEVTKSLCSTFSQLLTVSFRQQQPHLHLPHCKLESNRSCTVYCRWWTHKESFPVFTLLSLDSVLFSLLLLLFFLLKCSDVFLKWY